MYTLLCQKHNVPQTVKQLNDSNLFYDFMIFRWLLKFYNNIMITRKRNMKTDNRTSYIGKVYLLKKSLSHFLIYCHILIHMLNDSL